MSMTPILVSLAFITLCAGFAVPNQYQTKQDASLYDYSWIDSYAAVGDSYSVGIGAGHPIKSSANVGSSITTVFLDRNTDLFQVELNPACWQYSHGYPNQLNTALSVLTNPSLKLQFLGCSGALITDVLQIQVPLLSRPQLVTLSAGGNDADLSTILNYCIYQWAAYDSWTCERVLAESRNKTESAEFSQNLDDLLTGIKKELRDDESRIYYTAYSKFWDVSDTACDNVTWSITRLSGHQYLTQNRR